MPILALADPSGSDRAAADAATALGARLGVPVERIARLDDAHPPAAELVVATAGPHHPRVRAPMLLVRAPAPFAAWARGERPLRVLLGWADDTGTDAALAIVAAWRLAGPVELIVGHVYFPDEAAARYGLHAASMVEPTPGLEPLIARDIAHRLGVLPGTGAVTVVPKLGLGRIADHLMELADAEAVDVIAVGHHARGGLRRLSAVAERIVGDAGQAVLLVPVTPEAPLVEHPQVRVVLAATDGSPLSNHALPYAYALAPAGGEVHLVTVIGRHAPVEQEAARRRELEALIGPAPRVPTTVHVARDEDPARAIAHAAERLGADVVCVASHGRTAVARVLLGSTTDKLLHLCRRPVLVLHPTA